MMMDYYTTELTTLRLCTVRTIRLYIWVSHTSVYGTMPLASKLSKAVQGWLPSWTMFGHSDSVTHHSPPSVIHYYLFTYDSDMVPLASSSLLHSTTNHK